MGFLRVGREHEPGQRTPLNLMTEPDASPVIDTYRGRIAPTPSGWLHLGHAQTFWQAHVRARAEDGVVVLRMEDLDPARSQPDYVAGIYEDLRWFGFDWNEGPDRGGSHGPYEQSQCFSYYRSALDELIERGSVYRCYCSRRDIRAATQAPHVGEEGPLYPGTCRDRTGRVSETPESRPPSWRFRVPDGRVIEFEDQRLGRVAFEAGRDFGDFVVWRPDDVPSYQLAVVVDDERMAITEVVRGEDLLLSTCRQLLLFEAFGWKPPLYYHCPLVCDESGQRLAKRQESLSLRQLRSAGRQPEELRESFELPLS